MNYWIFQSVVEQQDLRHRLQEGKGDTRLASRYRQQMSAGDLVFFWLGGSDDIRGIYGWGKLLSDPEFNDDRQEYRVRVRYDKRLTNHLLVGQIRAVNELKNLLILRAPQATNFILSRAEAKAIANLIDPNERPEI
jgi:EVE domain